MPIDRYLYDFSHLVNSELPALLKQLETARANQIPMAIFAVERNGPAALAKKFGHSEDFQGCYLLSDQQSVKYVGISRCVLARLRQHVRGTTHYDATLAYRMAAKSSPHKLTRADAMTTISFKASFDAAKALIRSWTVAYVRVENPLVLYVFEAYCAMYYDTAEWNTFETH